MFDVSSALCPTLEPACSSNTEEGDTLCVATDLPDIIEPLPFNNPPGQGRQGWGGDEGGNRARREGSWRDRAPSQYRTSGYSSTNQRSSYKRRGLKADEEDE